ncbi:DNA polymerase III subunit gamma and tau [Sphaerimonospora sp. CA-214678]|uniref:DNA polymerase III subunit gamma and tau n=1 Tax=Sphaerimonospora sp. CA-214678 TaxID=3240029 RepID=UPI003D8CFFED
MSLALYRKYRPGTFAEVKGQEHVTEPLRQALLSGRVNHAYLFSGPRGCGKTSSARILARSLNCEKGPTPDPCGECESCVALAPTGPGHLDVIEIDAASHGGVDDARDLRERAFFAPVSARFKIYIIDEAHMVTREGFNALLKLVEEPPPHLKFVFATTEPEKVIGTIKSRTHHYPFRLMPPATLRQLMEEILESESVPYEPAALPLVVRAGAGSARDSLSILDQLLAGADEAGITYQRAVSLLGYTDGDLLDEVIGAFARRDGAQVFNAVNRVIEGGHDPRRFAADLLERLRDLVILANVPEAASSGLFDRPADELERLQEQAASMGPAELTRAAEVFNAGLTEMRGATSPRLLLELMCARVLLPAADQGEMALLARLERLERGALAAPVAGPSAGSPASVPPAAARPPVAAPRQPAPAPDPAPVAAPPPPAAQPPAAQPPAARTAPAPAADDWPTPVRPGGGAQAVDARTAPPGGNARPEQHGGQPAAQHGGQHGAVQQVWPQVLEAIKNRQRVAWMIINAQGRLLGVEGDLVTVGFEKPGDVQGFLKGKRDEVVAAALGDVLGGNWRVDVVVGGAGPAGHASRGPASRPAASPGQRPQGGGGPARSSAAPAPGAAGAARPSAATAGAQGRGQERASEVAGRGQDARATDVSRTGGDTRTTDESWPDEPSDDFHGSETPAGAASAARSAVRAATQSRSRQAWPDAVPRRGRTGAGSDLDDVDPLNDADADVSDLTGLALVQRELGGQIIEEIDHS